MAHKRKLKEVLWFHGDSNPEPTAPQADALTTVLFLETICWSLAFMF